MYEFQHTQLSLLREAISRRGQCTDALVSNTSSVAYTYRMRLMWSTLQVLGDSQHQMPVHHACAIMARLRGKLKAWPLPGITACGLGLHAWLCC